MTKAEKDAAIETLDSASLAAANAFQVAQCHTEPAILNSFEIAALNAFGLAISHIRSLPTTEE